MKLLSRFPLGALVLFGALAAFSTARADQPAMVQLKTSVPPPLFTDTPEPFSGIPNMAPSQAAKAKTVVMVPATAVNLAKGKPATSSDNEPTLGDMSMLTDGVKEGDEGNYIELRKGKQWVQIDLGKSASIYAVVVWHFFSQARVYHGVVVQISDDPNFVQNVKTVFNNDYNNSLGFGVGKDYSYIESNEGKTIDTKGTQGRYVRLYSNGNTTNEMNHYIEVEVWGT
jgi:hypothetical protein